MKVRQGFVSNSSTTSYIVVFVRLTSESEQHPYHILASRLLGLFTTDETYAHSKVREDGWTKEVRLYKEGERTNEPAFGRFLFRFTDDREFGEAEKSLRKLDETIKQLQKLYPGKMVEIAGSTGY